MICPKVSVVTVTYNAAWELRCTLSNLSRIDYPALEVVVIDGASTDGTRAVLSEFAGLITYASSEPDNGIYDAMNKGLRASTGDFVWFINAGDFVHDPRILTKIFASFGADADIYYGETLIRSESGKIMGLRRKQLPHQMTWKSFRYGMVVSHQSIIVRRDIAPQYDLSYRYAADIEWVIESLKKARKIVNTEMILSEFTEGGTSTRHRSESLRERFRIMVRHFGLSATLSAHAGFVLASFKPKYRKIKR